MKLKSLKEFRVYQLPKEKITRATASGSTDQSIIGYAAIFNQPSKLIAEVDDGQIITFYEIIDPNAFDEVLADPNLDVTYNIDHDNSKLIGRTNSNLKLSVDSYGLRFECNPIPDTTVARDLYTNIQLGLYFENSFCFTVAEQDEVWEERDGDMYRTINKVSGLYDTATVVNGAYANTTLSLRGKTELKKRSEE